MIKEMLGKQLLFFDGAIGTKLHEAGLSASDIPETWNITHSDIVRDIHLQYLVAGSDIITTNTFGCNTMNFRNKGYKVEEIVTGAVANAKAAVSTYVDTYVATYVETSTASKKRFIALNIGPTGKLLKPLGDLHFEKAVELFKETIITGAKAGADLILIETMSDAYELKAAVIAAKENCDLPIIASVTLDEKGKMLTGGTVDVVVALLEGLGVDAIGFNCGLGPEQLSPYINQALKISSVPLLFMPNAGLPAILMA